MVVHVYNPCYLEHRDRIIKIQGQLQTKKNSKTQFQKQSQVWWYMSVIPATQEAEVG
jgi:hypothetical protein